MRLHTWIAFAAAALVTACAASRPPEQLYRSAQYARAAKAQEAGADPSKIIICEQTMVTGSHIPNKRCWTKLELDVAQERAQKAAMESQRLDR